MDPKANRTSGDGLSSTSCSVTSPETADTLDISKNEPYYKNDEDSCFTSHTHTPTFSAATKRLRMGAKGRARGEGNSATRKRAFLPAVGVSPSVEDAE